MQLKIVCLDLDHLSSPGKVVVVVASWAAHYYQFISKYTPKQRRRRWRRRRSETQSAAVGVEAPLFACRTDKNNLWWAMVANSVHWLNRQPRVCCEKAKNTRKMQIKNAFHVKHSIDKRSD